MKIIIVDKVSLAFITKYEAAAPNQANYGGPWGDPNQTAHIGLDSSLDPDCIDISLDQDGNILVVADQAKLTAKAQASQKAALKAIVSGAITFGSNLLVDFASENIAMGITIDGKTKSVRQAMQEVTNALATGSLYDAIDEMRAIPADAKDSKYITDARLLAAINKIEAALGKPLSTSL